MNDIQVAMQIRTAIKQGDVKSVVDLLSEVPSRLSMMTPFGTWVHVAARMGKLEIVKILVEMGADINANGGISGGTPLNEAAADGHAEVVGYLLARGAIMDVDVSERNPLFSAIYGGHTAVAKTLIDHGIDTRVSYSGKLMKEMDAAAFAREWGRTDILELIRKAQNG